jgi:predicted DCC family thiol-disulfide oxidoreductase YuxK
MKRLTVLYDASCGFCVRCCDWLRRQPKLVPLAFVPARSVEARTLFPGLRSGDADELVVVNAGGGVYRGERAFIMCLYALQEYRGWSYRFAEPALRPLARRAFEWLSHNRKDLSRMLSLTAQQPPPASDPTGGCGGGACG